jgi:hypothetical protein
MTVGAAAGTVFAAGTLVAVPVGAPASGSPGVPGSVEGGVEGGGAELATTVAGV